MKEYIRPEMQVVIVNSDELLETVGVYSLEAAQDDLMSKKNGVFFDTLYEEEDAALSWSRSKSLWDD